MLPQKRKTAQRERPVLWAINTYAVLPETERAAFLPGEHARRLEPQGNLRFWDDWERNQGVYAGRPQGNLRFGFVSGEKTGREACPTIRPGGFGSLFWLRSDLPIPTAGANLFLISI